MWLVVGLGNPGAEYAATRHNIGFMVIDALAGTASFSKKFQGELAEINRGGEKLLLLKPQTYMNNSGRSVQAAMAFYKVPLDHIIVIHDELDLPLGKLRIKQGGGNNGHNGLKDIDAAMGPDYWRVRLGIGHPGDKGAVHGHVLNNFSREEKPTLAKLLETIEQNFTLFFEHSPEGLMSKVSDTMNPPQKKTPAEEATNK